MTDQTESSRANRVIAMLLLVAGTTAALMAVLGLLRGHQSAPGGFALILCFLPYVASALILQITGRAGVAISITIIPAIADVMFATALAFGTRPGWDDELAWSAVRAAVTLIAVPICLGVALWIARLDQREQ
jgi:divalent metal cation (Fe/Co/Zn/Cd) transporter